jgi:hypothetical protein
MWVNLGAILRPPFHLGWYKGEGWGGPESSTHLQGNFFSGLKTSSIKNCRILRPEKKNSPDPQHTQFSSKYSEIMQ